MTNPSKDYKDYVLANLPLGITYNSDIARFSVNNHTFFDYTQSNWYLRYIEKYGYTTLSSYAINSFEPALVFDFASEYYRTGGSDTTYDNAITTVASTNGTMVDSDGLLKWRPHNLLTYSEQFDNEAWIKSGVLPFGSGSTVNTVVAPDGNITADFICEDTSTGVHYIRCTGTAVGVNATFSVYVKSAGRGYAYIYSSANTASGLDCRVNLTNGAVTNNAVGTVVTTEDAGSGWWRVRMSMTGAYASPVAFFALVGPANGAGSGTPSYTGDGTSGIYVWGAHLYRSDLGGMVNNPDRGDSYVPTTSAARYLPRRGHHVYNGSAWVNKGLLVESEARTNLVTYSDFSAGWTIGATNSFTKTQAQATGRDGQLSLAKLAITDTTSEAHQIYTSATITAGATYSLSVDAKFGDHRYWALRYWTATNHWAVVVFDLQTGTVTQTNSGSGSGVIVSSGIRNHNGIYHVHLSAYTTSGTTGYIVVDACSTGTPTLAASDGTEAFVGVAGAHSFFGAAQLEAGSTPSSYIPTAGATATRAAETFTVPAANLPWPSPTYVTGTELVTNGAFDTDTAWLAGGGWSIGAGVASTTAAGNLNQSTCVASVRSKVVMVSYDIVSTMSGSVAPYFQQVAPTVITRYGSYKSAVGSYVDYFVVPDNASVFGFNANATAGSIDNISVKEINPLSVSIQMQGEMTYADTDNAEEVLFLRWAKTENVDEIELQLRTSAGRTGEPSFLQRSGGVSDSVVGPTTTVYSPDINVPFNIASRHGSTFINGAVDGTALTADLTPVALPDLHATNLNLGYTFMGTISEFRMWADDLGDTGIAEASA